MTKGFARVGQDNAVGVQLGGGQDFVRVDGALVVLLGDPVAGHGLAPHAAPVMGAASNFVTINGVAACIQTNAASCGHTTTGSDFAGASE